MAAQLNERQEKFALLVAQGMSATKACSLAGYAVPRVHSAQLMKMASVQARLAELKPRMDEAKVRAVVALEMPTREWVISKLKSTVFAAETKGDRTAMLRGLELLGKELGMFVQRTMELKSPLDGLSAEEVLALVRALETLQPAGPLPPIVNLEELEDPAPAGIESAVTEPQSDY